MHPPRPSPFRQEPARPWRGPVAGFARRAVLWHPSCMDRLQGNTHRSRRPVTPSLYFRPARSTRGPGFLPAAQFSAKVAHAPEYSFPNRKLRVYSKYITINQPRGRAPCVSRPSFWRSPPRIFWQDACRTPHRADLLALRQARSWPMPPTTTRLPARSSVVWLVPRPAASTWAFPPATDPVAASAAILVASTGRGHTPRAGCLRFFITRGAPCSRKS